MFSRSVGGFFNGKKSISCFLRWIKGRLIPPLEQIHLIDSGKNFLKRLMIDDPLTPAQVLCLVAITILLMTFLPITACVFNSWALVVNGRVVAVSPDRRLMERAVEEGLAARGTGAGGMYQLAIRRAVPGEGPLFMDERRLEDVLAAYLVPEASGTELLVDGEAKLVVRDRQVAAALLEALKREYTVGGGAVTLAGNVSLRDVRVPRERIMDFDEALSFLKTGGKNNARYTVRAGDTLWDIAPRCGVSMEELQLANPGLTPEKLQIGQVININRTAPVINVICNVQQTEQEEIPFTVEQRKDDQLYRGQTRMLQPGRPGLEEVTYQVTYLNGKEVKRDVLSRRVVRESQNQVVAVGSRVMLASRSGVGTRLAWPVVGSVSSPFGQRWGRLHTGMDITAGTGTPVRAAGAGRVIGAGWEGSYGNCVEVYHGDGVTTRYAHLSSISVRAGQQVERGQLLGRVGSTGNATGPHLHFEVLVNGRPVDPARFL